MSLTFMQKAVPIGIGAIIMVVGSGFAAFAGIRTLSNHNDIVINRRDPYQFQTRNSDKFFSRERNLNNLEKLSRGELIPGSGRSTKQ